MSETNIKFAKDIAKLIKHRDKIPDEFWVLTGSGKYRAIWFMDRQRPSVEQSYNFDMERFGITKEGHVIWGFDSGCSCPSPWEDDARAGYQTKEWKEFIVMASAKTLMAKDPSDESGYNKIGDSDWFDSTWDNEVLSNLKEFMLLIKDDVDAADVISAKNAEVRRFLMKRVGFEKVKTQVNAEVIHKDGTSELLKFADGDHYVKVKDSSTEREYLLYVPGHLKTCRAAIAWTFGLSEQEYKPIIET